MIDPHAYSLISAPAALLTAAELRDQARLPENADEAPLLDGFVAAATAMVETYLRRPLVRQTWRLIYGGLATALRCPKSPVQSIELVTYLDPDGVRQTAEASTYRLIQYGEEFQIGPAFGEVWPSHRCDFGSVEIDVVAGYGAPDEVPDDIVHAVRLIAAEMVDRRQAGDVGGDVSEIPFGPRLLLAPHRYWV